MAQRFTPQKVPSVTEHARDFLRRSPCAARRAEFFLYEKMGRRALDHEGCISEAGSNKSVQTCPPPLCALKKDGNPRGRVPLAEVWGQSPHGLAPQLPKEYSTLPEVVRISSWFGADAEPDRPA